MDQLLIRIIDDDVELNNSLKFLLTAEGWDVASYTNARDFLVNDSPSVAGCLLLDVRMPGMSGLELQKEMNEQLYQLPVVFISGHGTMEMAVGAMKDGAVDFIAKPIDPTELVEAIKRDQQAEDQKYRVRRHCFFEGTISNSDRPRKGNLPLSREKSSESGSG
ncbi:response regulator [uncultured Parasutterella sp.]|uniref:response regulator transcription factor n=1 Tax=uncultured Parasutterella sp. TaxID=1263098 RepID=UPI0025B705CF|nr:response regulator [uncultured Parasutterella sp.]